MSTLKVSLLLILLYFPFLLNGQKRNTPFSTSNNYLSWQVGVQYPYFGYRNQKSSAQTYQFSNEGLNFGVQAGIGMGHFFSDKYSISFSPALTYSKFSDTDYNYEYSSYSIVTRSRVGSFHYSHLGFHLPIDFSVHIHHHVDVTIGGFFFKPVLDRQYNQFRETDYTQFPPKTYSTYTTLYKNRRSYDRAGIHMQCSFLVHERDWKQKKIYIEYYDSLTRANFQVREKWLAVGIKKVFFQ